MPLSPPVTIATLPLSRPEPGIARLPRGLGIELRLVAGHLRLFAGFLDVSLVDAS